MSFVTPAEPKPRPSTVSMAVYLLYLVAGIEIIGAILTLSTFSKTRDVYLDAYRGTPDEDTIKTVMTVTPIVTVLFAAIFAAAFIVLGILDGKGRQPARIVTWVLGGLAVLCLGCGTAFSTRSMGGSSTNGGPDPDEVRRRAEDALPSWQAPVSVALTVLSVLALLVVIVLLALPASNPFFAKEQQVWVPPTEWSGPPGSELPPPPPPPGPPSGGAGGSGAPPPLQ